MYKLKVTAEPKLLFTKYSTIPVICVYYMRICMYVVPIPNKGTMCRTLYGHLMLRSKNLTDCNFWTKLSVHL